MAEKIALCTDFESLRRPELIGLAGENLEAQPWLQLFSSAQQARQEVCGRTGITEVWILSDDQVEPINLAAAIKRDHREMCVCLLATEETGSLMSRASAAGIDVLLTQQTFTRRYADAKRAYAAEAEAINGEGIFERPSRAYGNSSAEPASAYQHMAGSLKDEQRYEPKTTNYKTIPCPPRVEPRATTATQQRSVERRPTQQRLAGQQPMDSQEKSAVQCREKSAVPRGKSAFLLPVVSGSGGAGKSTVAALTALIGQRWGYRTLLLDFDLQFGNMRDLLGMPQALGIDEVLAAPARLNQLEPNGELPALLGAPKRLEDAEAIVREAPRLLDSLLRRFDLVVANTGASWGEQHAVLLERSSKALFLVDQRFSSLRACQHALDLCERCGIATGPFVFAATRCTKGASLTSIDVSCALRGAHAVELKEGGRDVEELMGSGQPLDLLTVRNDLCMSLQNALADIFPHGGKHVAQVAESQSRPRKRLFGRKQHRGKRG